MDEVETVPDNEFDVVWGARQWVLCVFNVLLGQRSYGYSSQQAAQLPALVYGYMGPIASATVSGAGWWNRANVGSAEIGLLWVWNSVCTTARNDSGATSSIRDGSFGVWFIIGRSCWGWDVKYLITKWPRNELDRFTVSLAWAEFKEDPKYTSNAQMFLEQRDLSLS